MFHMVCVGWLFMNTTVLKRFEIYNYVIVYVAMHIFKFKITSTSIWCWKCIIYLCWRLIFAIKYSQSIRWQMSHPFAWILLFHIQQTTLNQINNDWYNKYNDYCSQYSSQPSLLLSHTITILPLQVMF